MKYKNCAINKCRYAGIYDIKSQQIRCDKLSPKMDYKVILDDSLSLEERGYVPCNDNCSHYKPDNKLHLGDVEIEVCEYTINFECPMCGYEQEQTTTNPYFNDFEFECENEDCGDIIAINTDD